MDHAPKADKMRLTLRESSPCVDERQDNHAGHGERYEARKAKFTTAVTYAGLSCLHTKGFPGT